jgi:hypothetical protein
MFLVFGLDNVKKEGFDTTIIVDEDTVWSYKNRKWINVSKPFSGLSWEKYEVYDNNEKLGKYYLWYSDKWYAFDSKKNAVLIDGDLLGVRANYDVLVYNHDISEIEDYSYVYSVLKENNIPVDSEYTSKYKIVLDYDNDGEEEEFYVITNAFPMDFEPENIFSIVFMVKDEEIYPIYNDISTNTGFNGCKPYISSFIDVDEDSKYEFILSCAKFSTSSVNRMLYEFKDNEFKILISNNK